MFHAMLSLEFVKVRRTLAWPVCALAPLLVAIVAVMIALRKGEPAWRELLLNGFALWAYFVLPMTVAALSALLAQIEHGPRAWDHLFALPIPRRTLVVAKVATLMLMLGVSSILLLVFIAALGVATGAPSVGFPASGGLALAATTWCASAFMAAVQLWVALAVRSFVAPVGLGLAGTFAVVAAMGAPETAALPWGMPLAALPVSGANPMPALIAGALGGLLILPLMAAHVARREF